MNSNEKTLLSLFMNRVERTGDKIAILEKIDGEYQGFTYDEFKRRVQKFSAGLANLGVKKGDKIALMSENRSEWVITDLGILSLGAVNVPIYPTITPQQIEYILNNAQVKLIVVSRPKLVQKITKIWKNTPTLEKIIVFDFEDSDANENIISYQQMLADGENYAAKNPNFFDEAVANVKSDDLCGIIYTSGTTGSPKGVMLAHSNIYANVEGGLQTLNINESDTFLSFLPLCHVFERMAGFYLAIGAGAAIAYAESIDTVVKNLGEVKPTIMTSVPRLFERIQSGVLKNAEAGSPIKKKIFNWAFDVSDKYMNALFRNKLNVFLKFRYHIATKLVFSKLHQKVGGNLKYFISGGAPLARDVAEFFFKAGILILEGYGLTETSPVIAVNRETDFKFGTVGQVLPNVEVKIASDFEILTRGPAVMKGYYRDPNATKEVIDDEGWLHTGDLGFLDEDGFLHITDRKKNIIVTSGGKNVTPSVLENQLISSPYIEQVVIIGDKRKYLTALIVPNLEAIQKYATDMNTKFNSIEELIKDQSVHNLIRSEINRVSGLFARFEQIKRFTLLPKEFTIENDELTPTLKVKKNVILKKYAAEIEAMYHNRS
ncbi:long-chain fatty acid--CoA ligase [candidate division KSB1 bacterium]|nr:long-chain fatty acid--CoA ligase [candidate division KSB1 bacterium]